MDDREYKQRGSSMFGPIVLIAVGAVWLLSNFNLLPPLNWSSVIRLWPLLLIFGGLNMIVRQAPRPFGGLLSALIGLIAVGVFASVLLFGQSFSFLERRSADIIRNEPVAVESAGIDEGNGAH